MSKLEKLTHVLLIAVCCGSLFLLAERRLKSKVTTNRVGVVRQTQIGKALRLAGANWEESRLNVVIGLRSTCPFCAASLPFYKRLSEISRQRRGEVSVLVVSPEKEDSVEAFLSRAGVSVDRIFRSALEPLGVDGTPTIFVVDSRGIVRDQFAGKLEDQREKTLLAKLEPE